MDERNSGALAEWQLWSKRIAKPTNRSWPFSAADDRGGLKT
jgi:hypothetical protein